MHRFKGVMVTQLSAGVVEVVPLYHAKRGSTVKARGMRVIADTSLEAMQELVPVLLGRQDLRE